MFPHGSTSEPEAFVTLLGFYLFHYCVCVKHRNILFSCASPIWLLFMWIHPRTRCLSPEAFQINSKWANSNAWDYHVSRGNSPPSRSVSWRYSNIRPSVIHMIIVSQLKHLNSNLSVERENKEGDSGWYSNTL